MEEWRPAFEVGERHFRVRRRVQAAFNELEASLRELESLGTVDPLELGVQRQRLSFARRAIRQLQVRGIMAHAASVVAEYNPEYKTWDEAEGAVLGMCDAHGVRGAGDAVVLADADGMRGVKAFKKKRRALEKKLGGRVASGYLARKSE